MAERKLPQDLEIEQKALSCAFISGYSLDKICDELEEEMFADSRNRIIYNAMVSLHQKKIPLQAALIRNEIEKTHSMNDIGGYDYLVEIIDNPDINAAYIQNYIDVIRDKYLRRKLINVTEEINKIAYENKEDTNDLVDEAEKRIFSVTKARKAGEFKSIASVMESTRKQIETLSKNQSEITGIASGFTDLDKITSGFHENELIIVAARPAMGKTAFALNLAVNAAKKLEKSVALFNMEMSAEQLAMRMIAAEGGIDLNKIRNGNLNNDWKSVNQAISNLGDTNLFIEDNAGMSISEIRAKCRRLATSEKGLGLVVIDYLQLITGSSKNEGNRVQEVSEISRSLKTMAMELNIPVIALAQLSRSVELRENKRPIMSDLRESGSIEQDADIVMFLYRDDYYNKAASEASDVSITELIIGKHRNGSTGTIKLAFERNMSNFANYKEEIKEK